MVQEYFPFDSGAGATITETQWRRMARLWAPSGVETGLVVSAGSGSNVNVSAGSCWIDGHYYRTDATVAVPFTPNTLAQPQLVRVVARLDPTANTIVLACTTVPLVQLPTGNYELLLAEFTLPPSGTAQTPTNITDNRQPCYPAGVYLNASAGGSNADNLWLPNLAIQNGPGTTAIHGVTIDENGGKRGIVLPPGRWLVSYSGRHSSNQASRTYLTIHEQAIGSGVYKITEVPTGGLGNVLTARYSVAPGASLKLYPLYSRASASTFAADITLDQIA